MNAEFIPKTPNDYDLVKQRGDFDISFRILKISLIAELNRMFRIQNPSVERDILDLFSIIKKSKNSLKNSGFSIDNTIFISIDQLKNLDSLVENRGFITFDMLEQIEDLVLEIYMEFRWKFEEEEIMKNTKNELSVF